MLEEIIDQDLEKRKAGRKESVERRRDRWRRCRELNFLRYLYTYAGHTQMDLDEGRLRI